MTKKAPVNYTDAYYAPDGYRTKQFRARVEIKNLYPSPQGGYEYNEFSNRSSRRRIAKSKGVFTLGIWKDTVKNLDNVQTYVKPEEENEKND